jgi:hypothetical protein
MEPPTSAGGLVSPWPPARRWRGGEALLDERGAGSAVAGMLQSDLGKVMVGRLSAPNLAARTEKGARCPRPQWTGILPSLPTSTGSLTVEGGAAGVRHGGVWSVRRQRQCCATKQPCHRRDMERTSWIELDELLV